MSKQIYILCVLVSLIALFYITGYIISQKKKSQLHKIFLIQVLFLIICNIGYFSLVSADLFFNYKNIVFEYILFLGATFSSVFFLLLAINYKYGKLKFTRAHLLLFVPPIITNIVLWTNSFHHLFYNSYGITDSYDFGPYFYVSMVFTWIYLIIATVMFIRNSLKNSNKFSMQAKLMVWGSSIPLIFNFLWILGSVTNISWLKFHSYYDVSPITLSATAICFSLAIFKYGFLKIAPIALRTVVDYISDGYLVINLEKNLVDYNKSFLRIVPSITANKIKANIFDFLKYEKILDNNMYDIFMENTELLIAKKEPIAITRKLEINDGAYAVEMTPIINDNEVVGIIILFKDITELTRAQDIMVEQERLSSLGQLIGGIAHNLKTPIMSIAGVVEGLTDLIKEYDESIDDPSVNKDDHHEIAKEMQDWVDKVKPYLSYMTEVIDAVKGQAVSMNASTMTNFTIKELITRTQLLMKNELKRRHCNLNLDITANEESAISGEISALIRVIDNMIINAMDAYGDKAGDVDIKVREDNTKVYIDVTDYAGGIPQKVQDKLFKEMITSKGKNGTGLGLYMSFSTIKGKFKGDIRFETEEGKGTTFFIELPKYVG